jgi:hypothetical protein
MIMRLNSAFSLRWVSRRTLIIGKSGFFQEPQQYGKKKAAFDLTTDLMEQKNLLADPKQSAKLAEMRGLLKQALAPLPNVFGEFKAITVK